MIEGKSRLLKDVDEEYYRNLPYCSYSFLARLDKIDNKVFLERREETPALKFGSLVDCLTLTNYEFEDRFFVVKEEPTASSGVLAKQLVERGIKITDVNKQAKKLLGIMDELSLWSTNKEELRLKKITKEVIDYVNYYIANKGKTIVSMEDVEKAHHIKIVLENHKLTSWIFNPKKDIEVLFQVKGINTLEGTEYKFMCDIVVIDHKNKTVTPYDLKTGAKNINEFEYSFLDYRYDIQFYLYSLGVKNILGDLVKDYSDYEALPLQFIYIDKSNIEIPAIYSVPDINILDGYTTKYGRKMRGVRELMSKYNYYIENGFIVPKRWAETGGHITLEI